MVSDAPSRESKHVLIYGINYSPEPIGVGRYTGDLGAYLSQRGARVSVVTAIPHYPGWAPRNGYSNRYMSEEDSGISIVRCPLFLKLEMRGLWRLFAPLSFAMTSAPVVMWKILLNRPDVVLCVEPTLFSAPIAVLFASFVGARRVLHVQDLEMDAAFAMGHLGGGPLKVLATSFERFILRRFDRVVTISNRMREKLIDKGLDAERVCIVRNWVDLEKIKPLPGRSSYRDDLEISDEKFVALYAGNVGQKQGLDILLGAARLLRDEPKLLFVIAGDGPEKSRLISQYGDLPNVCFLPVQPEARLCELLNLANVHLLPQDRGAADLVLPSKLAGMLASGKPSIVLADPGTELFEFIGDGALIVPPGDVQALAECLRYTLVNARNLQLGDNSDRVAKLDAGDNLSSFRDLLIGRPVGQIDG